MLERDFVNSQDFILSLKMEWTQSLYPQIREKFLALDKVKRDKMNVDDVDEFCLLYTSPSPRDQA